MGSPYKVYIMQMWKIIITIVCMQICFCFAALRSNEPMEKSFKWHYTKRECFSSIFASAEDAVHKEMCAVSDIIIAALQWAFSTFQQNERSKDEERREREESGCWH